MANKKDEEMFNVETYWLSMRYKLKWHWDCITHQSEWLLSRTQANNTHWRGYKPYILLVRI
jgi:hypothetical protein